MWMVVEVLPANVRWDMSRVDIMNRVEGDQSSSTTIADG